MKSLVAYATRTGNSRIVAEAVARSLARHGAVTLAPVDEVHEIDRSVDLVVVGGPTEGRGMVGPVIDFFDRLPPRTLEGRLAAAFDTRLRWPRFLSGSAADGIAERLRLAGATVIVPPESFIVTMRPRLELGQVERAEAWAIGLASRVSETAPDVESSRPLAFVGGRRG
jgi:flavodoxin